MVMMLVVSEITMPRFSAFWLNSAGLARVWLIVSAVLTVSVSWFTCCVRRATV